MSISNVIISTPDDVYNLIKSGKELSTKFPYNHSKKTNGKVINLQLGRIWINNGIKQTKIHKEDHIPEGWVKGRCDNLGDNNPMRKKK